MDGIHKVLFVCVVGYCADATIIDKHVNADSKNFFITFNFLCGLGE